MDDMTASDFFLIPDIGRAHFVDNVRTIILCGCAENGH